MKRTTILITGVAALASPSAALADHKPDHQGGGGQTATTISALDARPNPLVFGMATELSGRLSGGNVNGVVVRLEADETRPYGDAYTPVSTATGPATATTNNAGRFAFTLKPALNTQYRAVAQASPPVTSAPKLVLVRTRVGLIVSDLTPRAGALVRFRGTVRPAHDGARALIQRRSGTGRFVTVARATLRDAGTELSRYSRRIRVRRDGVYRVKVAGDADHVNGYSRTRRLDVG